MDYINKDFMMKKLFFLFIGALTICGLSSCEVNDKDKQVEKQERHERKW